MTYGRTILSEAKAFFGKMAHKAPTLVVWGEEPTLYVGAAQIKAFLREYAQ